MTELKSTITYIVTFNKFQLRYLSVNILTGFCSIFCCCCCFSVGKLFEKVNIFDISFDDACCVDANYSLLL